MTNRPFIFQFFLLALIISLFLNKIRGYFQPNHSGDPFKRNYTFEFDRGATVGQGENLKLFTVEKNGEIVNQGFYRSAVNHAPIGTQKGSGKPRDLCAFLG